MIPGQKKVIAPTAMPSSPSTSRAHQGMPRGLPTTAAAMAKQPSTSAKAP